MRIDLDALYRSDRNLSGVTLAMLLEHPYIKLTADARKSLEGRPGKTANDVLDLLTKEEEQALLEALSSKHQFTETSDPSK